MVWLLALVMASWVTRKLGECRLASNKHRDEHGLSRRHLNIGAGRIVWQDIVRIDVAIKKREFHKNPTILESFKRAKDGNGRLHLLGLVEWGLSLDDVMLSIPPPIDF
jgi:hypothetical protein